MITRLILTFYSIILGLGTVSTHPRCCQRLRPFSFWASIRLIPHTLTTHYRGESPIIVLGNLAFFWQTPCLTNLLLERLSLMLDRGRSGKRWEGEHTVSASFNPSNL